MLTLQVLLYVSDTTDALVFGYCFSTLGREGFGRLFQFAQQTRGQAVRAVLESPAAIVGATGNQHDVPD